MRQGLFPICIICAVTVAASWQNFGKPSIATEKSFCNSKGVRIRSKQCKLVPTCDFWIGFFKIQFQNACWEIPNPFRSAPYRCRLRVFTKRFLVRRRSAQPSRKHDNYRVWGFPISAQMYIRLHCLRKKPNLKQYRMYGEIWLFNISWFSDFHSWSCLLYTSRCV